MEASAGAIRCQARGRRVGRLALVATAALSLGCMALSGRHLAFASMAPQTRLPATALQATATKDAPVAAAKPKPKAKPGAKPGAKPRPKPKPKPLVPVMDQLTTGIMAPLVVIGYAIFGEPFVGKVRGKGIGLHSQAINAFCERFAIPSRKRQGFIKTAKKTGHDLGFLIPGGHWGDGAIGPQALEWYKDVGIDRWDVSHW